MSRVKSSNYAELQRAGHPVPGYPVESISGPTPPGFKMNWTLGRREIGLNLNPKLYEFQMSHFHRKNTITLSFIVDSNLPNYYIKSTKAATWIKKRIRGLSRLYSRDGDASVDPHVKNTNLWWVHYLNFFYYYYYLDHTIPNMGHYLTERRLTKHLRVAFLPNLILRIFWFFKCL